MANTSKKDEPVTTISYADHESDTPLWLRPGTIGIGIGIALANSHSTWNLIATIWNTATGGWAR